MVRRVMSDHDEPGPVEASTPTAQSRDADGDADRAGSSQDPAAVRLRVRHDLYNSLALLSSVVWMLGTFLLFIIFAAGNPRPIPAAMMSMTVPLVFAALPWLLFRPLTTWLTSRRLRSQSGVG